jgi:hypothetical protein
MTGKKRTARRENKRERYAREECTGEERKMKEGRVASISTEYIFLLEMKQG